MFTRRHLQRTGLAAVAAVVLTAPALAQTAPPVGPPAPAPGPVVSESADRALMNRLVRQVRKIDREKETLLRQAVDEARRGDGKADLETKAKLLSLRDERDRLYSRMLVLSMRHGWEIPSFDTTTKDEPADRDAAMNRVFGSIDRLVEQRFAAEARRRVALVRLPVVSIESTPK